MVVAAHEDPKALIRDGLTQLHPSPDCRCSRASLADAGLGASDDDEVDLSPRREFTVALGQIVLGERQLSLIALHLGRFDCVTIRP